MLHFELDNRASRLLLGELVDRLEQPRGMQSLLVDVLADYEEQVFGTRGLGRWASDDPDTIAAKGNGRVLVDTGNLLDELTNPIIEGEGVRVSAGDADYAGFLKRGSRGMPRRDPAPEPPQGTVEGWAEQLLGYLITGARR